MKFNIEDFKKHKFAINCETVDEAKQLEQILAHLDIKTHRGHNWVVEMWHYNQSNTCYSYFDGMGLGYSRMKFAYECHLPVYKFSELDFTNDTDTPIEPDMVNHPNHYQGKYECIDLMVAMFGVDAVKGFCKCNSFKYRFRADRKNGQEDIQKAEFYEDYLMKLEGKGND